MASSRSADLRGSRSNRRMQANALPCNTPTYARTAALASVDQAKSKRLLNEPLFEVTYLCPQHHRRLSLLPGTPFPSNHRHRRITNSCASVSIEESGWKMRGNGCDCAGQSEDELATGGGQLRDCSSGWKGRRRGTADPDNRSAQPCPRGTAVNWVEAGSSQE